ncbi:N/A [soil metagenome]
MAGRRGRSAADRRRRELGQNLLVDRDVIASALRRIAPAPDDLIIEVGPGRGALTLPLARSGARVVAVERDPAMVAHLRARLTAEGLDRVRVIGADVRRFRWPGEDFRVVGNLPFGLTTVILEALLDDPSRGPQRADLLIQREVARKRAATPPTSLRSAAWAPWWDVELGEEVPRRAFRPVPAVDGAWVTIRRRTPPVLPEWLAPGFRDVLRGGWSGQQG